MMYFIKHTQNTVPMQLFIKVDGPRIGRYQDVPIPRCECDWDPFLCDGDGGGKDIQGSRPPRAQVAHRKQIAHCAGDAFIKTESLVQTKRKNFNSQANVFFIYI